MAGCLRRGRQSSPLVRPRSDVLCIVVRKGSMMSVLSAQIAERSSSYPPESAMPSDALWSRACLLLAAFLFSTGGAAIKGASFTSWEIAGTRSLIAAVALLALAPEARRRIDWRHALVGLSYALTLVAFVTANKLTTSANAIFCSPPTDLSPPGPRRCCSRSRCGADARDGAMATGMSLVFAGAEAPTQIAADPTRATCWPPPPAPPGRVVVAYAGRSATTGSARHRHRWKRNCILISLPFFTGTPHGAPSD
jgi:hypothetical protein